MTDVTLKALAAERQVSVDRLVQQFADAGIRKSADDSGPHKKNRLYWRT